MIHPDTTVECISNEKGLGVVATKLIKKGTVVWVKDKLDIEMSADKFERLPQKLKAHVKRYGYRDAHGQYLICWDFTKYMNHSYNPNCMITPYGFEIAIEDISAGHELTNDYGALNVEVPMRMVREEKNNRAFVCPNDIVDHHKAWDSLWIEALQRYNLVDQPLSDLMSDWLISGIENINAGQQKPLSLLGMYCPLIECS
jgi:hypothetical protein